MNLFQYTRLKTHPVKVGNIIIGGNNPIRIQSMTNTNTLNTQESIEQSLRIVRQGGELVRITAQGIREAENLKNIKTGILDAKINIPLAADIHFNPKAAFIAAEIVEKVRINPGNFVDKRADFTQIEFTDEEYKSELKKIEDQLIPLINICKANKTALRIGVNHGSLSDRIMSHYGDTPDGMVESAMEFLRICVKEKYENIVVSLKSSNTRVMVQANRLMVTRMLDENMHFPLHLGVTEAGEGEDGRIKSAVGIGTLLADGLGDTIRVSLTEPPEDEIPVAKKLVAIINEKTDHQKIEVVNPVSVDFFGYKRRETIAVGNIGGNNLPVVVGNNDKYVDLKPDYIFSGNTIVQNTKSTESEKKSNELKLIVTENSMLDSEMIQKIARETNVLVILESKNNNAFADQRAAIMKLINANCNVPVILKRTFSENNIEDLQLKAASEMGGLFIDGLADGIWLENNGSISNQEIVNTSFGILQASRVRMSKTEYISCPGCGRTLFDLQKTTSEIRKKTSSQKHLKIGIMGCIVNGPGEMADADYGYVGAGPGKITLYKNKDVVKKNIPEEKAVDELIQLIKDCGDWKE
ncbi:MAG: 4-hydroxy-3-methylbut-2-en-1-yl diphosphate synthase [Bacteroidetes bacterium GWF2_33_16]|nr:MAG: 4-hydroxy-3-methylbut-2-en-1-yl diphosphate synthase [Bacteroidetes bacterium GWE2_32_14]OFY03509.1 MAG: 4-hydroxy-3-methylbut-2-en-1-yl diphosphate synthase [Bacteroidetes bacterium GWF2_33_16]